MMRDRVAKTHAFAHALVIGGVFALSLSLAHAESSSTERAFRQSKNTIENAISALQPAMSGHLPTLEGFAQPGEHPLERYQRGFYQCDVQVRANPKGGSIVRVTAKVTAWYSDSAAARSGYQVLLSNGRIENDILDQLADHLADTGTGGEKLPQVADKPFEQSSVVSKASASDEPVISAPMPNMGSGSSLSSSAVRNAPAPDTKAGQLGDPKASKESDVHAETASLESVLKSQVHPRNLVAVKKSGTAIVASPSLTAKTLFLASAQDEFELLDYNADWVHVRISGPSRGWIWRTSLEMPEGISDVPKAASAVPTASDLFEVSREETGQFPGDWQPLRGKSVKIISVQKVNDNESGAGAKLKLEFAKAVIDKSYTELNSTPGVAGVVLIFDSADGGMIAATLPTIQKWRAGRLTDAAMWHQCYFDPPETFTVANAASGG